MNNTVISELYSRVQAISNCRKNGNREWDLKHSECVDKLLEMAMPHGSGFDAGVKMDLGQMVEDLNNTRWERLVFDAPFHVMDEDGYYDGWEEYRVAAKPGFCGITLTSISGRARGDLKDYVLETLYEALTAELPESYLKYLEKEVFVR